MTDFAYVGPPTTFTFPMVVTASPAFDGASPIRMPLSEGAPVNPAIDLSIFTNVTGWGREEWLPFREDLVRFIPHSSWPWLNRDSISHILGDHDSWLTGAFHERHPILQQFATAVLDGTFTLSEGASPMTDTATAATFAEVADLQRYYTVTAEQFAPWRETFIRYVTEVGYVAAAMRPAWREGTGFEHLNGDRGVLANPSNYPGTLPRFATWLSDHGQTAPDAVTTGNPVSPAVVAFRTAFEQLTGNPMAQEVNVGIADAFIALPAAVKETYRDAYVQGVRLSRFEPASVTNFDPVTTYSYAFSTANFFRWLKQSHRVIADDGRLEPEAVTASTPEESTVSTTTESVVVPIGPSHPDWARFDTAMAQAAARNGMCSEYERVGSMMQLSPRHTQHRLTVTMPALELTLVTGYGRRPTRSDLRAAMHAYIDAHYTDTALPHTINQTETTIAPITTPGE